MGKLLKIIISVAIILSGLAEQYPTMASGESSFSQTVPSNIMNVKQLDQTRETTVADIGGHWAKKQIAVWIEKGLAAGYEDGMFRPEDSVTSPLPQHTIDGNRLMDLNLFQYRQSTYMQRNIFDDYRLKKTGWRTEYHEDLIYNYYNDKDTWVGPNDSEQDTKVIYSLAHGI